MTTTFGPGFRRGPVSLGAGTAAALRAAHEREEAAERAARPAPEPTDDLTDRELEVLRLLAAGHSDQAIGNRLHLSRDTIKTHLQRMRPKLDARGGRANLVDQAWRLGVLP